MLSVGSLLLCDFLLQAPVSECLHREKCWPEIFPSANYDILWIVSTWDLVPAARWAYGGFMERKRCCSQTVSSPWPPAGSNLICSVAPALSTPRRRNRCSLCRRATEERTPQASAHPGLTCPSGPSGHQLPRGTFLASKPGRGLSHDPQDSESAFHSPEGRGPF